jgi:fermentation-respiration switch protein FrsA (DUF1100 family)
MRRVGGVAVLRRVISAAICALVVGVHAPAAADGTYLSPDGRHAVVLTRDEETAGRPRRLALLDVGCLFAGNSRAACSVSVPGTARQTRSVSWSASSDSFIATNLDRLWFRSLDNLATSEPTKLWGLMPVDPTIFDPVAFPGRDPKLVFAPAVEENKIFNAAGEQIGALLYDETGAQLVGPGQSRFAIPDEIAFHALLVPRKYAAIGSAQGKEVYFWSPSMGRSGLLLRLDNQGVTNMDVPEVRYGAAHWVLDVSTSRPVALFDAFGVYALPEQAAELSWLISGVNELRAADASLEFSAISLSAVAETAIVEAAQGLTCTVTYALRPSQARFVDRVCRRERPDFGRPTVHPLKIPLARDALTGRLYTWDRPARGLLIVFPGGPQSNSIDGRPWIAAEALGGEFDVLAVDYRGSIGFGWETLTALGHPISDIALADVSAAVAHARTLSAYAGKPIGFWGDSFGGFAGHLAATRDDSELAFVVSNSGFAGHTEERSRTLCDTKPFSIIFGATTGPDGGCILQDVYAPPEVMRGRTPLLMLVGEDDQQTVPEATRAWLASMSGHGCVSQINSEGGSHMLSWPARSRERAIAEIRRWVDRILTGQRSACRLELTLP